MNFPCSVLAAFLIFCTGLFAAAFCQSQKLMDSLEKKWDKTHVEAVKTIFPNAKNRSLLARPLENKIWEGLAKGRTPQEILWAVAERRDRLSEIRHLQKEGDAQSIERILHDQEASVHADSSAPPRNQASIRTQTPGADKSVRDKFESVRTNDRVKKENSLQNMQARDQEEKSISEDKEIEKSGERIEKQMERMEKIQEKNIKSGKGGE